MVNRIQLILSCTLALSMLYALYLSWRYERNSKKELEDFERKLDPNFDNHRKEWDHINNNYTVFINRM